MLMNNPPPIPASFLVILKHTLKEVQTHVKAFTVVKNTFVKNSHKVVALNTVESSVKASDEVLRRVEKVAELVAAVEAEAVNKQHPSHSNTNKK